MREVVVFDRTHSSTVIKFWDFDWVHLADDWVPRKQASLKFKIIFASMFFLFEFRHLKVPRGIHKTTYEFIKIIILIGTGLFVRFLW
jgi:hypothetical protein